MPSSGHSNTYIHTYSRVYIHSHACVYMCMCLYIHMYIYMDTHQKGYNVGEGWEGVYEKEKYISTLFSWVLLIFICFIFAGQSIYH